MIHYDTLKSAIEKIDKFPANESEFSRSNSNHYRIDFILNDESLQNFERLKKICKITYPDWFLVKRIRKSSKLQFTTLSIYIYEKQQKI